MDVLRYRSPAGSDPVGKYIDGLSTREAAEVHADLVLWEQHGLAAAVNTRQIKGKLWELKVGAHRFFFVTLAGPVVVLLHAYRKQGQRAPIRDIGTAAARMKEVLGAT